VGRSQKDHALIRYMQLLFLKCVRLWGTTSSMDDNLS